MEEGKKRGRAKAHTINYRNYKRDQQSEQYPKKQER
jgi:hypothetical protein